MSAGLGFRMHAERTPNPQSIKWVLGEPLVPPGVTAHFQAPVGAEESPLAARLFEVAGVVGVLLAANFVTVTKRESADWTDLAGPLVDAIKAHAASGQDALGPGFVPPAAADEGDVVTRIRRILEEEVRPAVAMDGGDVVFAGYREGRVELYLQGSCSGCPSSTATLKFGIEARLKEAVPEIVEVVAL